MWPLLLLMIDSHYLGQISYLFRHLWPCRGFLVLLLDLISQPEAQRRTTELRYIKKQLFFSPWNFPCCLAVSEKMIIGVSVGEGEGAHVNKISEKFQATEPTVSKTKTAKYTLGLGTLWSLSFRNPNPNFNPGPSSVTSSGSIALALASRKRSVKQC